MGQKPKIFVSVAYAAIFLVFLGMGAWHSQASVPGQESLPVHCETDDNREEALD